MPSLRVKTPSSGQEGLEEEGVLELGCGEFEVAGDQPGWEFSCLEKGPGKLYKHQQDPEFWDTEN